MLRLSGGKAPRIEAYLDIHDLSQKTMLAGSACKQAVHRADGLKLVDLVNRFPKIYCRRRTSRPCASPAPIRRTSKSPIPSSDERTTRATGAGSAGASSACGRSMMPTLNDGDHVLLKRYGRFRRPQPGDVACIRSGGGEPMLIKRLITRDGNARFGLAGDGAASAPAIDLGYASEREIVGRRRFPVSDNRIRVMSRR
jgi:hypothetical protein